MATSWLLSYMTPKTKARDPYAPKDTTPVTPEEDDGRGTGTGTTTGKTGTGPTKPKKPKVAKTADTSALDRFLAGTGPARGSASSTFLGGGDELSRAKTASVWLKARNKPWVAPRPRPIPKTFDGSALGDIGSLLFKGR